MRALRRCKGKETTKQFALYISTRLPFFPFHHSLHEYLHLQPDQLSLLLPDHVGASPAVGQQSTVSNRHIAALQITPTLVAALFDLLCLSAFSLFSSLPSRRSPPPATVPGTPPRRPVPPQGTDDASLRLTTALVLPP